MDHAEIAKELGEIKGTLTTFLPAIDGRLKNVEEGVSDFRCWKNRIVGMCLIVSSVVGFAWQWALKRV